MNPSSKSIQQNKRLWSLKEMERNDSNFKIGTTLDFIPPVEAVQLGLYCEKLGFDSLWAVDHLD